VHYTVPELKPYEDAFLQLVKDNCKHPERIKTPPKIIIKFSNSLYKGSDLGAVGVCRYSPLWWEIEIDKPYWNMLSSDSKKTLTFHELSHCYLGTDHNPDEANYMYEFLVPISKEMLQVQVIDSIKGVCND
jgi:hypothetical protein